MKPSSLVVAFALLLLHLQVSSLLGQERTGRFQGQVLGTDGRVLSYATLLIEGHNMGAYADHLGRFRIDLPAGKYEVHVSAGDYEAQSFELHLVAGTAIERWFRLRPELQPGETYRYPPPPPEQPRLKAHPISESERANVIRGRVIERSGLPMAGVSVTAPGSRYGWQITDSEGRYTIDDLPAGEIVVSFRCPSKSWGREIESMTVLLVSGEVRDLDLVVEPDTCWEPTYAHRTGRLTGVYSFGFEYSQFEPCATLLDDLQPKLFLDEIELLLNQAGIWVESSDPAWPSWREALDHARNQNIERRDEPGKSAQRYYVDWIGTLTGPGRYGHMGMSSFHFEVDSVIQATPVGAGRWCPPTR